MAYVDGFLLAVPTRNLAAYRRMSRMAGKVWLSHGALSYKECAGDDVAQKGTTTFPKLLKLKKGETAVFSWIVYKSRRERDRILPKIMADKRLTSMGGKKMPFDMKRMAYGGFSMIVDM
jgi:uncharacterized protein YbaA (DUF1428 family)